MANIDYIKLYKLQDDAKDIIDIYLIDKYYTFNSVEIIEILHKKAEFIYYDLIIRFKTFPSILNRQINLIEPYLLDNFENEYLELINNIIS